MSRIAFGPKTDAGSEQKANMLNCPYAARSCRVTITEFGGYRHAVEVTAGTLYEAVALGLAAIRGNDGLWESADG